MILPFKHKWQLTLYRSVAVQGTDRRCICPVRKVLRKRVFGGFLPFSFCSEKWSGLNRISHTHWVKICDHHNGQINLYAKQNMKVFLLQQNSYLSFIIFYVLRSEIIFQSVDTFCPLCCIVF